MQIVRAVRRHNFPMRHHKEMLLWLQENIQDNFFPDGQKYNSSSVSQFVEWRSKDKISWVLRIVGNPPSVYVEIDDVQKELLFLLRWQ